MANVMKIDQESEETVPPEVVLTDVPQTLYGIQDTNQVMYMPINAVENAKHINYRILSAARMIDFSRSIIKPYFQLQYRDTKGSGTWKSIPATEDEIKDLKFDIIQGVGSTFPKNIRINVMGQEVFHANNLYAFYAHANNELRATEAMKRGSMSAFGYFYEAKRGERKVDRLKVFAGGKYGEYAAPIYADIFDQPRYMLSNTEITIEVSPHQKEFMVIYDKDWAGEVDLKLVKCEIFLTFVDLFPGLAMDIEEELMKKPAKYPYRRIEIKSNYHEEKHQFIDDVVFTNQVPHDLVIMQVPTGDIHSGNVSDDPFNVVHAMVTDVRVISAGHQVPYSPWNLEWNTGLTVRAYEHFLRHNGDIDTGITREMWENGHSFLPFMLTSTMMDDDNFDNMREGPTIVSKRHAKTIGEALKQLGDKKGVSTIYIGAFQAVLRMDATRTVRSDLTA